MKIRKCKTKFCRGVAHASAKSCYCSRCRTRRFKEAHPIKYSFGKIKSRAKERGREFTLTYAEFEKFAIETDWQKMKGKTRYSLSIDRIDGNKGYIPGNIRAITLGLNSRIAFTKMPKWMIEEMVELERLSRQKEEWESEVCK